MTQMKAKKIAKPRKPENLIGVFSKEIAFVSDDPILFVVDTHYGDSKRARVLAAWLLKFADWAEAKG